VSERRIKAAANQAVYYRNYRRARDRAFTRLAQAHPDQYKEYLEEEKASDEQLGKKWLDIAGNTSISNLDTRADGSLTRGKATNNSAYQGNAGGEE
jgi:hypothetical protein